MSKINALENSLMVVGASYGISQIESVLGVIILVMQCILLLVKYVPKIVIRCKTLIQNTGDCDITEIDESINDVIDDVESFVEELEELKNEQSK